MRDVLVGGGITLAVALLVQLILVPHVQTRHRRRERWENDVLELWALLDEELPRAQSALRSAGNQVRSLIKPKDSEAGARNEDHFQSVSATFYDASRSVGELMARMARLEGRSRLRHSKAHYWRRLQMCHNSLHASVFRVEWEAQNDLVHVELGPGWKRGNRFDNDAWWNAWTEVDKARKTLLSMVEEVAVPLKPPPTHPLRRARRRVLSWAGWLWAHRRPWRTASQTPTT